MNILIHANRMPHQQAFAKRMWQGIRAQGGLCEVTGTDDESEADLHIYWSERNMRCKPALVAECGYLNALDGPYEAGRLRYTSFGFNGQHGRSEGFPDMPPDRAKAQGLVPRPMRMKMDGFVVIFGQCPGDFGVAHLEYRDAIYGLVDECISRFGEDRVRFKPHPLFVAMHAACQYIGGPLGEVLDQCSLAVTVNSNAAVDALMAGIPTVVTDSLSVAYPVAMNSLDDLAHHAWDLEQWAANLAYRQYTKEEIESGLAWATLYPIIEGKLHEYQDSLATGAGACHAGGGQAASAGGGGG